MINRFTLKYKDQTLENKYQEYWYQIRREPLAKTIAWSTFLILITRLIEESCNGQLFSQPFSTSILSYFPYLLFVIMLAISIRKQSKKCVQMIVFCYCHCLGFGLWVLSSNCQGQTKLLLYVVAASLMIIIQTNEFLQGTYLMIFNTTLYTIIQNIQVEGNFSYYILATTLTVVVLFVKVHRENLLAFRSQFQLQFLNNQWEKMFLNNIQGDFLLFFYDDVNMSFELKQSRITNNQIKTTEELKQTLRSLKNNTETLEQYCFQIIQQYQNNNENDTYCSKFVATYKEQKKAELDCQILFGPCITILIRFNSNIHDQIIFEEEEKIENTYQFSYKHIFGLYFTLFLKQQKQFVLGSQLNKFSKVFLYQYLKLKFTRQKQFDTIKQFKLESILQFIKKIYKNKNITWNEIQTIQILNNKYLILLILIKLIENSLSDTISIQIIKNKSTLFPQIQIIINTIFNDKLINLLQQQIENYSYYIKIIHNQQDVILVLYNKQEENTENITAYQFLDS